MSDQDRSRQSLIVLGAGAVLLGAAALLVALIAGPGPASRASKPAVPGHEAAAPMGAAVTAQTESRADGDAADAVAPAVASDPATTGALPDEAASPDHPPAGPVTGGPEPAAIAIVPAAQPEPASEAKPAVAAEPSQAASPPTDMAVANVESADRSPETGTPARETSGAEAPAQVVTPAPEPVPTEEASATALPEIAAAPVQQPIPAPETKIAAVEATPEPPQAREAEQPKEPVAAPAQGKPKGGPMSKPMTLGAGGGLTRQRIGAPAARAGAGAYAASVRSAIGRHRPRASGGGSATVTFAIGPAGALRGVQISRSSGRPQLDQAALASVRNAAPFPPPPAGLTSGDLTYTIKIFFR